MGIIINDTITLNNGLTASTIYCSFGDDEIEAFNPIKYNMV